MTVLFAYHFIHFGLPWTTLHACFPVLVPETPFRHDHFFCVGWSSIVSVDEHELGITNEILGWILLKFDSISCSSSIFLEKIPKLIADHDTAAKVTIQLLFLLYYEVKTNKIWCNVCYICPNNGRSHLLTWYWRFFFSLISIHLFYTRTPVLREIILGWRIHA